MKNPHGGGIEKEQILKENYNLCIFSSHKSDLKKR